jgi:hypothetical protein
LRDRLQPLKGKPKGAFQHGAAEHAKPEQPDSPVGRLLLRQSLPLVPPLQVKIGGKVAVERQHRERDILLHHPDDAVFHHPHHLHLGRNRQ